MKKLIGIFLIVLIVISLSALKIAHSYTFAIDADWVSLVATASSAGSYMGIIQVSKTDYNITRISGSANASISGEHKYFENYPLTTSKVVYNASAWAVASASMGFLKVNASSSGDIYAFGNKINEIGSSAHAEASMTETLHFFSNVQTPFKIDVIWEVDGFINARSKTAYTKFNTAVGGPHWFISDEPYYREPWERKDDLIDGYAYFRREIWMNPNSTKPAWGHPDWEYDPLDLSITGSLFVNIADGEANFSETGKFTIIMPEGISFISSSGVFLSEIPGSNPAPIPLPPTIMFLASGLIGLWGVRNKFRK